MNYCNIHKKSEHPLNFFKRLLEKKSVQKVYTKILYFTYGFWLLLLPKK